MAIRTHRRRRENRLDERVCVRVWVGGWGGGVVRRESDYLERGIISSSLIPSTVPDYTDSTLAGGAGHPVVCSLTGSRSQRGDRAKAPGRRRVQCA